MFSSQEKEIIIDEYCNKMLSPSDISKKYNVSKVEWDNMLENQKGHCALCDRIPKNVDRDHSIEKVRGLLCNRCNSAMAAIDNKEWMGRAVNYAK